MKALVTGANGLIGANLTRELINQGCTVRAFVRKNSNLKSLEGIDVEKSFGDILEIDTLTEAMTGCDILFHAAAIFSYRENNPDKMYNVAVQGTLNAVEAAKRAGIKKIVLTSSSVVFGSTANPISLDEGKTIPESDPSPYTKAKILQEQAAFKRAAELDMDIVAVCPTICVGPYDYSLSESNAVIINYLKDPFKSTWHGGCNIVSVKDVAKGHILAAKYGKTMKRYILGAQNLEWNKIHRMISEMCGIDGPLTTASHTSCYLAAAAQEFAALFTKERPLVTRVQAKMVGRYYWYRHAGAASIGYNPIPARQALAIAISWLVASPHVPASLRGTIRLSEEIYSLREREYLNY